MKLETLTSAQHIDVLQPVSQTGPAATDDRTDVKPFFETLPRELRDCIYDLLYQEVEESMGYDVGDLEFHTRAIIPRLRFVSRQFKAEYDERISMNDLNQQLTVIDSYTYLQPSWPPREILCSPISSRTTSLTINMVNDYYCAPFGRTASSWNPSSGTNWLERLTQQLPNLRQLRLRVIVPIWDSPEISLRATPSFGEYFPQVNELQVLSYDDITYAARPLGTWSKEGGMQRHEDAIAKHEARHIKIMEIVRKEISRE
jgi:hypothetical protein